MSMSTLRQGQGDGSRQLGIILLHVHACKHTATQHVTCAQARLRRSSLSLSLYIYIYIKNIYTNIHSLLPAHSRSAQLHDHMFGVDAGIIFREHMFGLDAGIICSEKDVCVDVGVMFS